MGAERSSEKLRVFISYARSDASAFAEELRTGLEVAGFDAFLDRHDIAPGEDWEKRLNGLLQSADTVVYVLTPASVSSERCAWEVSHATALSKRIVPVVAIDVQEKDTPAALHRLNYIFFTPGNSFTRSLSDLATALRTDLDWIREHTRLLELAERWRERGKPEVLLLRGSELENAKAWLSGWKAGAPEPTDIQRGFINESETAEQARNSVERQRLRRLRGLTYLACAAVIAVFVVSVIGGVIVYKNHEAQVALQTELDAKSLELDQTKSELDYARSQLAANANQLATAAQSIAAPNTRQQADSAVAAVQENLARLRQDVLAAAPASGNGWRADVFWCEALGDAARSRAETVAGILRSGDAGLGVAIASVRVRPLSAAINARPSYSVTQDEIRPEASERGQAQQLAQFIAAHGGPTLSERVSGTPTPAYLSIFICGQ